MEIQTMLHHNTFLSTDEDTDNDIP
jgi:hypothetical protein